MKKKFISDLELGEKVNSEQFVLKSLAKKTTKNGDEYWDLKLGDKSGEISAKVWNNSLGDCDASLKDGDIVVLSGKIEAGLNGQGLQLFVNNMKATSDFDHSDFLASSERSADDLWADLQNYIDKIQDEKIKALLELIFSDKDFFEKYRNAPAAEKAHHDFIGGLMQHSLEMMAVAKSMFSFYPELNQDIVIAGILLHDIGKVCELSVDASINRTESGHMLGHIYQGAELVGQYMNKIADFPEKTRNQIIHIILSHHGYLEYGSPITPKTMEAYLVHFADLTSSKMQILKKILDNNKNNEAAWSEYSTLLSTKIYLGEKEVNNEDSNLSSPKNLKENLYGTSTEQQEARNVQGKKLANNASQDPTNNLELPF